MSIVLYCYFYFFRNLVIALKELSIKGDFRTTVEYLITLLETQCFQENRIDTSWLDALISEKVSFDSFLGFIFFVTYVDVMFVTFLFILLMQIQIFMTSFIPKCQMS